MDSSLFIGLILAIVLGGLIGIERELPRTGVDSKSSIGFGGIRSFAAIAFLWAIWLQMDHIMQTHIWSILGFVVSSILIITSYVYNAFWLKKMWSTTEYAAFLTYFIGMLAMSWQYIFAVIGAIFLLLLLSIKTQLEALKDRFSRQELGDTLKFAVISLVFLPILPDQKYSLLNIINWFYHGQLSWHHPLVSTPFFDPYSVWLFVVIMTGVEYIWYILSKVIGSKWGIIVSGIIGWIISSTATTIAITRKSIENPENRNSYVVATLVASCIMFIRVVLIAGIIDPNIIPYILIPAGTMFLTLVCTALYFFFRLKTETVEENADTEKAHEHDSPFQIFPAIKFAGMIIVIKFISMAGIIYQYFIPPAVSNYTLGLISWLIDIDPLVLTIAGESKSWALVGIIAATTILIAMMSNNVIKASIAYRFWDKQYGGKVVMAFGLSIIIGLITIAWIYMIHG